MLMEKYLMINVLLACFYEVEVAIRVDLSVCSHKSHDAHIERGECLLPSFLLLVTGAVENP